jgi:hypothetical protein
MNGLLFSADLLRLKKAQAMRVSWASEAVLFRLKSFGLVKIISAARPDTSHTLKVHWLSGSFACQVF